MAVAVEPTKVCSRCGRRKPWSEFYSYTHKGERRPLSRCKRCDKAYRVEWARRNPDKVRAHRHAYYQTVKADAERYYARLDRERNRKRRVRGTAPADHRVSRTLRIADIGEVSKFDSTAFVAWLRTLGGSSNAIASRCGMLPRNVLRYLNGEYPTVSLDTVDRACLNAGYDLNLLYPPDQAA